jgi:hypothetical protein
MASLCNVEHTKLLKKLLPLLWVSSTIVLECIALKKRLSRHGFNDEEVAEGCHETEDQSMQHTWRCNDRQNPELGRGNQHDAAHSMQGKVPASMQLIARRDTQLA